MIHWWVRKPPRGPKNCMFWAMTRSSTTHWVHSEDSCQTRRMPRLIWVFTGCIGHFVGFVMLWLIYLFLFSSSKKKSMHLLAPSATYKEYLFEYIGISSINNGFAGFEVGSMSDLQSDFNTDFTSSKPRGTIKWVTGKSLCSVAYCLSVQELC